MPCQRAFPPRGSSSAARCSAWALRLAHALQSTVRPSLRGSLAVACTSAMGRQLAKSTDKRKPKNSSDAGRPSAAKKGQRDAATVNPPAAPGQPLLPQPAADQAGCAGAAPQNVQLHRQAGQEGPHRPPGAPGRPSPCLAGSPLHLPGRERPRAHARRTCRARSCPARASSRTGAGSATRASSASPSWSASGRRWAPRCAPDLQAAEGAHA